MNRQSQEEEYVSGLELFLNASHEDRLIPEAIVKQMPIFASRCFQKIKTAKTFKILDVGSGNGQKAIYLAQKLTQQLTIDNPDLKITIDAIEPKLEQVEHLRENYKNTNFLGEIFTNTLENAPLKGEYDLVLILHSLYEFPRTVDDYILSLDRISKILGNDGCGVIAIESPEGEFQKMKRQLYPRFRKRQHLSLSLVTKTLDKIEILYRIGELIEYNSPINLLLSSEEIGKQFAFLFSDSLTDIPLKNEEYEIVGEWIKNNCHQENENYYLYTPDILIWLINDLIPAIKALPTI